MSSEAQAWLIALALCAAGFYLCVLRPRQRLRRMAEGIAGDLQPEANHVVRFEDEEVIHLRPDGEVESFRWEDLEGIRILTTADGPLCTDCFWLFDAKEDTGMNVPQGATGGEELLRRMQELPGFDHDAFLSAMASTDEAVFPVWGAGGE